MTDHTTDIAPTIYTATTPAELRAAVLDLCCEAILEWTAPDMAAALWSGARHHLHVAELVVPPVPPVWRVVTVSGHSYRCVNGVVEYRQGDGEWRETVWVHGRHLAVIADLMANPTEASA